ncbi:MAG: hypothetical protein ACLPY5_12830 [Candidatus Bathyarchaeia archaeon]
MATIQTQLQERLDEQLFTEFDLECSNCGFNTLDPEIYDRHNRRCKIPVDATFR